MIGDDDSDVLSIDSGTSKTLSDVFIELFNAVLNQYNTVGPDGLDGLIRHLLHEICPKYKDLPQVIHSFNSEKTTIKGDN